MFYPIEFKGVTGNVLDPSQLTAPQLKRRDYCALKPVFSMKYIKASGPRQNVCEISQLTACNLPKWPLAL
jgi:hypothetical protein